MLTSICTLDQEYTVDLEKNRLLYAWHIYDCLIKIDNNNLTIAALSSAEYLKAVDAAADLTLDY